MEFSSSDCLLINLHPAGLQELVVDVVDPGTEKYRLLEAAIILE
jgi:hypothetical protein